MIEEKYIELLLKRCLKVDKNDPLFISYNKLNKDFVDKVIKYAEDLGIKDIYLDEEDSYYIHDLLNELEIDEIKNHEAFNSKKWDEYAEKNAAFLLLDSEIPDLMTDIDSEKLAKSALAKRESKPIYKEKQLKSLLAWCIAAVPNEDWAKDIFPESEKPLEEFWENISNMCMLNEKDPIKSWDELLDKQHKIVDKLTNMKITKMHYKNKLGTDLEVELLENALWQSACSKKWIVNMPSYEVFTTPNYRKTNGIVYSSKPLIYNGKVIDEFYIEFANGKVKNFDAKEGKDILKKIIEGDKLSSYLGEVALVNYDSPISNTNKVFKSTLFDENASCHIALGSGFMECLENGDEMSEDELDKKGLNLSKNHVDFMIGTKDLTIEADTKDGKIIIMENGNLVI